MTTVRAGGVSATTVGAGGASATTVGGKAIILFLKQVDKKIT